MCIRDSVTLIAGPGVGPAHPGVSRIDVESALEMNTAVQTRLQGINLFIGVAAVADFRPVSFEEKKIKRANLEPLHTVNLMQNPDIIANVAKQKNRPAVVVGFAAETSEHLQNARDKRARKGIDAIVVNDVSDSSIGFNSDENAATLIYSTGEIILKKQSKTNLANKLIHNLSEIFDFKGR